MIRRTAAVLIALACLACGRKEIAPQQIVLWAWERPEDLRFAKVDGVAYLAATIRLHGAAIDAIPRRQPLRAGNAALIPVIRIEAGGVPANETIGNVVDAIVRYGKPTNPRMIQLDFDATESQRPYYVALVHALRRKLPPATRVSITALTSWCMSDRWLAPIEADEFVPMAFRMGPDATEIRQRLATGATFTDPRCRAILGISTDEPMPRAASVRRVYIFNPRPWNQAALAAVTKEIAQWE